MGRPASIRRWRYGLLRLRTSSRKFAPSVGVAERSRQVVVTVLVYLFVGDIPDVGGPLAQSRPESWVR